MFSKSCEYALKTMIYLASKDDDRPAGLRAICGAIDSPQAFTAKVLQHLVRHKLLVSVRGPNGGFSLKKDKAITLMDVVHVIDGEHFYRECVLGFENCDSEHPCALHQELSDMRKQLSEKLNTIYLHEMKEKLENREIFLTD